METRDMLICVIWILIAILNSFPLDTRSVIIWIATIMIILKTDWIFKNGRNKPKR